MLSVWAQTLKGCDLVLAPAISPDNWTPRPLSGLRVRMRPPVTGHDRNIRINGVLVRVQLICFFEFCKLQANLF